MNAVHKIFTQIILDWTLLIDEKINEDVLIKHKFTRMFWHNVEF